MRFRDWARRLISPATLPKNVVAASAVGDAQAHVEVARGEPPDGLAQGSEIVGMPLPDEYSEDVRRDAEDEERGHEGEKAAAPARGRDADAGGQEPQADQVAPRKAMTKSRQAERAPELRRRLARALTASGGSSELLEAIAQAADRRDAVAEALLGEALADPVDVDVDGALVPLKSSPHRSRMISSLVKVLPGEAPSLNSRSNSFRGRVIASPARPRLEAPPVEEEASRPGRTARSRRGNAGGAP